MLIITVLSFTIINLWRLLFYAASDGLLWFWLLIFISIKLFTVLSWKDLQLLGLHLSCSGGFTVNAILWVPFIFPLKTRPAHSSYFVESIWNNCSVHTFSFFSFMRPKLSITLTVILKKLSGPMSNCNPVVTSGMGFADILLQRTNGGSPSRSTSQSTTDLYQGYISFWLLPVKTEHSGPSSCFTMIWENYRYKQWNEDVFLFHGFSP